MDWRNTTNALIPGLEGVALKQLWSVTTPRTASEIHGAADIGSLNGVRLALERLVAQGLVHSRPAGNVILYSLNAEHLAYPALAAAFERYRPYRELRERLFHLVERHLPFLGGDDPVLAIYGSVARREATPESDLDLLLVVNDDAPTHSVEDLEAALREEPMQWTGNSVQVFRCSETWLRAARSRNDPILASWSAEADTVYGRPIAELLAGAA